MTVHYDDTPEWFVSAALDEIYALRTALAYEAGVLEASLDLKSFPKSRREISERRIKAMREAASGNVEYAYSDCPGWSLRLAYKEVTGTELMTRHMWETQRLSRTPARSAS